MMLESSVQTDLVTRGRRNPLHFGLPKRLRLAREASGLGPAQLSLSAGLADTAVRDIEGRGRVPRLDTVEHLARVLKISPCWLAYGVEGPDLAGDALASASVGERLRAAREGAGLSRKALARAAASTDTTIRLTEEGRTVPSVATIEALAKALGVDVCWLSYGQGAAPNLG